MSDTSLPAVTESTAVPLATGMIVLDPRERRMRWIELGLVLIVAFVRPLMTALIEFAGLVQPATNRTAWGWVAAAITEIPPLLVLAYVLSRNRRTFRDIGVRWSLKSCAMGVLLAIGAILAANCGAIVIRAVFTVIGKPGVAYAAAQSAQHYWQKAIWTPWAIPYMVITPFYEEIFVRAYMMTELLDLTGSKRIAIAASVILQSSYHLYYGWYGPLIVACTFSVWAVYFSQERKATPTIVAHWLYDLMAILAHHWSS